MIRPIPLASICLALAPLAAVQAATDHPLYRPARDVTITYAITSERPVSPATTTTVPKAPAKVAVAFSAASRRIHVDFFQASDDAAPFGSLIVDPSAGTQTLLMAPQRAYLEQPYVDGPTLALPLSDKMQFIWAGQKQLAGTPCTDWRYTDEASQGTVCVTSDGVLLRAVQTAPARAEMVATSVSYDPPPTALFRVPADYTRWTRIPRS